MNELHEIITSLAARGTAERQKEEPYKNLFAASEHGLKALLQEAEHQHRPITLNLCDVIEEKFGIKVSSKLYNLLKALPFSMAELRKNIEETEGNSCCADKTRMLYYEEVLAGIKEIQNES